MATTRRPATPSPTPRRPLRKVPLALPVPTELGPRRPDSRRRAIVTSLVVVAVIVVIAVFHGQADEQLPVSCTTPALAVPSTSLIAGRPFVAAITGPASGAYVLALDATSVTVVGGQDVAEPADAVVLLHLATLPGCRQGGEVGLPASVRFGHHQLGLFRTGAGGRPTALQTVALKIS